MNFRTPLARARGLGSAKEGVGHWWLQRLTALALLPLLLWVMFAVVSLPNMDHASLQAWLSQPWVAILWIVLCIALYYHAALGLQVVIEDYVHTPWLKILLLITVNFGNWLLAAAAVFFLLKIAFGA